MEVPRFALRGAVLLGTLGALGATWAVVRAQAPSKAAAGEGHSYSPSSSVLLEVPPRTPWGGYPYSAYLDAEIADSDVHRVLYADNRTMLMEVSNPPGLDVHMHGHPYASVFVRDSGATASASPNDPADAGRIANNSNAAGAGAGGLADPVLDPNSPFNGQGWGLGLAPKGMDYPACTTSPPQAPHKPMNRGKAPLHFYRIEFRRLDGEDIQSHWKEWYPEMAQPAPPVKNLTPGPNLGPNFSKEWPYPIVYDGIQAAPNNYKLLFEDEHLRFVEVTIRPGETTPMHGDPYPSVLAIGSISGGPSTMTDTKLDPNSPLNGQGSGHGAAPTIMNMKVPLCETMTPRAPHAIHNAGAVPLHYYQFDFKRIDGAGFVTNWQKWYPWMMYMKYMR
jgi:hypothetical protein